MIFKKYGLPAKRNYMFKQQPDVWGGLTVFFLILCFCIEFAAAQAAQKETDPVFTHSNAQIFSHAVKLSQREVFFSGIKILEPVTVHDQILDVIALEKSKGEISEDGIFIINFDSHMDLGVRRYTKYFFKGEWNRDSLKRGFKDYLANSGENQGIAPDDQWIQACENLEGSWGEVALARGWAKDIMVIKPDTFKKFKAQLKIKQAELKRLALNNNPVWVTIDYDYFSLKENYEQKAHHLEQAELDQKIYELIYFLIDNNVRVSCLVPCLSPQYINEKADNQYIESLNNKIKAAFNNKGEFNLKLLAAVEYEDKAIINYYAESLKQLNLFKSIDGNYVLNYAGYPGLRFKACREKIKELLEENNFPIPEFKIALLKKVIKNISEGYALENFDNKNMR